MTTALMKRYLTFLSMISNSVQPTSPHHNFTHPQHKHPHCCHHNYMYTHPQHKHHQCYYPNYTHPQCSHHQRHHQRPHHHLLVMKTIQLIKWPIQLTIHHIVHLFGHSTCFKRVEVSMGSVQSLPPINGLPSSPINHSKLVAAKEITDRNPKLMCESKVPTLALKLARESFFGEDVMAQCTVAGDRKLPALPVHELELLKNQVLTLFPAYWNSHHEFEPVWTKCTASIGQACKRLRTNTK